MICTGTGYGFVKNCTVGWTRMPEYELGKPIGVDLKSSVGKSINPCTPIPSSVMIPLWDDLWENLEGSITPGLWRPLRNKMSSLEYGPSRQLSPETII